MPITTPKVPDGLPELMKGLAKSVIKENPENIYVHAAEYFENLIRERDGSLEKGYMNFSAHKVYADSKDKGREKNGNQSSESAGEAVSSSSGIQAQTVSDGDDDESGGSAKASARGKRKKRARKQGSKGSNKSVDKNDAPVSADVLNRKGSAKGTTKDTITEEVVVTKDTIPKENAIGKGLSVDSEAAANAVLTVLGESVLDLEEADRETGEVGTETKENHVHPINCEDVGSYPPDSNDPEVEDFGSAPSTAEIVGEVVVAAEALVESANGSKEVEQISSNIDEVDLSLTENISPEKEEKDTVNGNGLVEQMVEDKPDEQDSGEPALVGQDTVDTAENKDHISTEEVPVMPDIPDEEPKVTDEPIVEESPKNVMENSETAQENESNVDKNSVDVDANDIELTVESESADPVEDNGKEIVKSDSENLSDKLTNAEKSDDQDLVQEKDPSADENTEQLTGSSLDKETTPDKPITEEDTSASDKDKPDSPQTEQPDVEVASNEGTVASPVIESETIEPSEDKSVKEEQSGSPQEPDAVEPVEDAPPAESILDSTSIKQSQEETESEQNPSVDQSDEATNESSTKESEAEESVAVIDQMLDAAVEEGELSVSSRMADGVEEPDANPQDPGELGSSEDTPQTSSDGNQLPSEPSAPPGEPESEDKSKDEVEVESSLEDKPKETNEASENATLSANKSIDDDQKDEVVEEPCVQREVSPSTSKPERKLDHSAELEEIKKVNLASFDANSAEALFYSLKKSELENEENRSKTPSEDKNEDDDADVVVSEETDDPSQIRREQTKRSFTDDFLAEGPITEEATEPTEGDGVEGSVMDEVFDPMVAATNRNQDLLDQMHFRDDSSMNEPTKKRAPMRRSLTEKADLSRQDSNYVDLRKYDPDYVEEEDQFDGYYIGNIRNKILASSVSMADSDEGDPGRTEELIDDNNVRTALETIISTDTESTLPSQITVQANRGFLKKTSNIPYASFGNNAIDQSLDEFIEREEQKKEEEAEAKAASKIQRSYRQFRSNKQKLLRDYHSTMHTFTEDQSTESTEDYSSVIKVQVDQKQPAEGLKDDSFEAARLENSRKPMYSWNIDEDDTVARRMTLTRGTALQKMSTREDESIRSNPGLTDAKSSGGPSARSIGTENGSVISSSELSSDKKTGTDSDEKENDVVHGSSNSSAPAADGKIRPLSAGKKHSSLDAQQKLFIVARQRTMPVQIDSSLIRMLPKHLRKRNKSAGIVRK
ncbi:uncharacterized protein LOC131434985 isoform X1 [Malaya genurostris]|uniref:uncharacterized protein LOC131434985 isoform X1 n=2 Tax=Malaya genurostris TaxID=325434 RepID=UPI0026F39B05|nr:uncharacterized protein LOC131434985 isoform X1 [Malaya genurostris]